jgi:hypothetical protein
MTIQPAVYGLDSATLAWLMEGDPAIRWQVMRDLLDAPEAEWQAERQRTLGEGWGSQFLACQDPDGRWGGGIYSPKWVSSTYTLLTLVGIGIPGECAPARTGARLVIDQMLGPQCDAAFQKQLAACDRCIVGMILHLAVYFGIEDERVDALVENLLAERMPDGAWNCRRHRPEKPQHSSFHTTLNVLEGLRAFLERAESPLSGDVRAAEQAAQEFLLQHRLFRSDKTGALINPDFTRLVYPPRWHYNTLRALSYFVRAGTQPDPRLGEAVALLQKHPDPAGRPAP